DLITKPRFDDPTYLTTLSILLAAIFVAMSWFSRSGGGGGGWGGRFSPFGRPGNAANAGEVTDSDFSYITSEDLAQASKGHHRASSRSAAPEIVDWDDKNPDRDTDVLVFKHGRTNYPTHFPALSIKDGELKIGTVRQAAAKKVGVDDPRRIRMFHKGRNLKHDERTAREEGLRGDGTGSEILCVVGEANVGNMAPGSEDTGMPGDGQRAWSDGSDEEDDTEAMDSGANTTSKKKSRKRGGKKNKRKNGGDTSGTSTPGYSNPNAGGAEFLPLPSHVPGPRPTSSASANIPRAAAPQTPLGKIEALASKFHTEFVPLCVQFLQSPPPEKDKRSFEYKKLSETILAQILLKLDGVETEGDTEARMRRKELVKEVQGMLNRLDESMS
ncbi:BAG domain-containing protein, partial [Massariosphaeria phaeospora]